MIKIDPLEVPPKVAGVGTTICLVTSHNGFKRGGLCAVGVPLNKGRANHHTFTLSPERGAQRLLLMGRSRGGGGGGWRCCWPSGRISWGGAWSGDEEGGAESVPLVVDNNNNVTRRHNNSMLGFHI